MKPPNCAPNLCLPQQLHISALMERVTAAVAGQEIADSRVVPGALAHTDHRLPRLLPLGAYLAGGETVIK